MCSPTAMSPRSTIPSTASACGFTARPGSSRKHRPTSRSRPNSASTITRSWPASATARRIFGDFGSERLFDVLDSWQAISVLGVEPALEVGLALFGEGGARFHQVALVAVLMQFGGERPVGCGRLGAHLAHDVHGIDARGRGQR